MSSTFFRAAAIAALATTLASCQPPDRDIIVVWRNGHLVVDFPWSFWRLIGLQDRSYCIHRVELFDPDKLLWSLDVKEERQCLDVTMPLRVGGAMAGFVSKGRPAMRPNVTYGIAIDGIGEGRVDFTLREGKQPTNERDWGQLIEPPCGSYFGGCPRSEPASPHRTAGTD